MAVEVVTNNSQDNGNQQQSGFGSNGNQQQSLEMFRLVEVLATNSSHWKCSE
jgi:hypothetical protein